MQCWWRACIKHTQLLLTPLNLHPDIRCCKSLYKLMSTSEPWRCHRALDLICWIALNSANAVHACLIL